MKVSYIIHIICSNIYYVSLLPYCHMAKKKITPEETLLAIGEKLKKIRIEKGYSSYEKFAWDNDINRIQYYRMEKGANITIKSLLKALNALGLTLEEFFKGL